MLRKRWRDEVIGARWSCGTGGFGRRDCCGGEAAELGSSEAEVVYCLGVGGFIDGTGRGNCGLPDEVIADGFEPVHREIAGFEGLDGEGGTDGFVHFFDGCADGVGCEEFDDLEGRQGELLFQGGDFAAIVEEKEEVAGVLV